MRGISDDMDIIGLDQAFGCDIINDTPRAAFRLALDFRIAFNPARASISRFDNRLGIIDADISQRKDD